MRTGSSRHERADLEGPAPGQGRPLVVSGVAQQLRQLGDVHGDAPRFIAGEQLRGRAPTGLLLEIDVGERLPVGVADDEAGVRCYGAASVRFFQQRRNYSP